ncbi:hypothetical protein [Fimbriiglobus ruber]|uniref:hypothetical protein n=1 Tax=Fimbriiglobus ruber TaxID=1908690 RepID=UPI00117AE74F|nr:hypothetical protein [Fimbriiglobus ruber]
MDRRLIRWGGVLVVATQFTAGCCYYQPRPVGWRFPLITGVNFAPGAGPVVGSPAPVVAGPAAPVSPLFPGPGAGAYPSYPGQVMGDPGYGPGPGPGGCSSCGSSPVSGLPGGAGPDFGGPPHVAGAPTSYPIFPGGGPAYPVLPNGPPLAGPVFNSSPSTLMPPPQVFRSQDQPPAPMQGSVTNGSGNGSK